MYRRPRFLEILIGIREEMAREADFDVDLFVENVRTGRRSPRPAGKYSMATDKPQRKPAKRQVRPRPK
jgi:hypothetical protein